MPKNKKSKKTIKRDKNTKKLVHQIYGIFDDGIPLKDIRVFYENVQKTKEFCKSKGSQAWFALAKWMKERGWGTGTQRGQCFNMGKFLNQGREPSPQLSAPCRRAWESMQENYGWNQ